MQIDISGLVALVVALGTLYKLYTMNKVEHASTDAEASDRYASASTRTAEYNEKLLIRIVDLENKYTTVATDFAALQRKLTRRDALLKEWQKGIDILLGQFCSENITPNWSPTTQLEDIDKEDADK